MSKKEKRREKGRKKWLSNGDSLDSSPPLEEEVGTLLLSGYVERKVSSWKAVYCLLVGSSFYWYKSSSDLNPRGRIDLQNIEFNFKLNNMKRKFAFSFTSPNGKSVFTGAVNSQMTLSKWKKILLSAQSLKPSPPPATAQHEKGAKLDGLQYSKKVIAHTALNSALGKKLLKNFMNDQTEETLASLTRIMKVKGGTAKKAEELEKNFVKIVVKALLLIENNILKISEFEGAETVLLNILELVKMAYYGRKASKRLLIHECLHEIVTNIQQLDGFVNDLLAPHLTSKNMLLVSNFFSLFADEVYLDAVLSNADLAADVEKLMLVTEPFTRYHYLTNIDPS